MPALIFKAARGADIAVSLLKIPLAGFIAMVGAVALAYIVGRLLTVKSTTFGALLIAASAGNTGYLGYPLTIMLFGEGNLVKAVFLDLFGTVIFIFTVGLVIAGRFGSDGKKISPLREILSFPPVLALGAAILTRGFELPQPVNQAIDLLAGATVVLIMLSIGLGLSLGQIKNYKLPLAAVAVIKLTFVPVAAFYVGRGLLLDPSELGVLVLEASMPSVMFSQVIALKYGLDSVFLPSAILLTTVLSLITIPLWQLVLL